MLTYLHNTWWLTALPLAFLGAALLALAACGSDEQDSLGERAQSIDKSLICPVCPGETIDQAQVELAQQMRAVVREKLAEGSSRDEVLDFFVDRYGESVLAAPPKEGFGLLAWVAPPAAVVAAAVLLFFVVRSMRRGAQARREEEAPLMEDALEPYLVMVDKELGLPPEESRGSEKGG